MRKPKLYRYIGSDFIKEAVANSRTSTQIKSIQDLQEWIVKTRQKPNRWGIIAATFIVDTEGELRIADRHSEHIACAGGEPVLSAGEVFLGEGLNGLEVVEITNQSTGFCPEPESWYWVEKALDFIPLAHPERFTTEFIFRRCPACHQLNIVKHKFFACSVCQTKLPLIWNC